MVEPHISGRICLEKKCYSCCKETEMPLSSTDIVRITAYKNISASEFTERKQGIAVLKNKLQEGEKVCHFLNIGGKCSIYHIRPAGCRYYPVIWNLDDASAEIHDFCPHGKEFVDQVSLVGKKVEKLVREILGEN